MTDITMCFEGCHQASNCYRITAKAGMWQSYSAYKPNKDGICKHYWPLNDKTLFSPTGSCDTETQILCSEFESIQKHTLSRTKQSKSSLQTGDEGSDAEPTSV